MIDTEYMKIVTYVNDHEKIQEYAVRERIASKVLSDECISGSSGFINGVLFYTSWTLSV